MDLASVLKQSYYPCSTVAGEESCRGEKWHPALFKAPLVPTKAQGIRKCVSCVLTETRSGEGREEEFGRTNQRASERTNERKSHPTNLRTDSPGARRPRRWDNH